MKTRGYLNLIPNKEAFMDIGILKMNINSARMKSVECKDEDTKEALRLVFDVLDNVLQEIEELKKDTRKMHFGM